MSQANTVTLQILDKEYRIACPAEERDNLESAARYRMTRCARYAPAAKSSALTASP